MSYDWETPWKTVTPPMKIVTARRPPAREARGVCLEQTSAIQAPHSSKLFLPSHRHNKIAFLLGVFLILLCRSHPVAAVERLNESSSKNTFSSSSNPERAEFSPDPSEEHYEGMVYLGRMERVTTNNHNGDSEDDRITQNSEKGNDWRRMGFHADNSIRFIFGTSFDDQHRDLIAHAELEHWEQHPDDMPERMQEHRNQYNPILERHKRLVAQGRPITPQPHGQHYDVHPLDGGRTPPVAVRVDPFFLDAHLVTTQRFAQFVSATRYVTEAEQYGWSFVLKSFLHHDSNDDPTEVEVDPHADDWIVVEGAHWRTPEGPGSTWKGREHHPVVHVSHRDAAAYCHHHEKRLPGEWEWEAAARWTHLSHNHYEPSDYYNRVPDTDKTHHRTLFAWSDGPAIQHEYVPHTPKDDKEHVLDDVVVPVINWTEEWELAARHANLWGPTENFPHENHAADGWRGTSPVGFYPPNAAGVYDMTGNVWEWMRGGKHKSRILRGASYVDSLDGSLNHAATLGAREVVHGTTTAGHIGFRCAKSPSRKVRHHWKWHDELEHGPLEDHEVWQDEDDDEHEIEWFQQENDEDSSERRLKKKKVVLMRERLHTEL